MTHDDTPIRQFQGATRWLSNFEEAPVEFEGVMYPTNEHAFQAAKVLDPEERRVFATLGHPSKAKWLGRRVPLRADWEEVKIDVMRRVNRDKFTRHAHLREKLLATGERELIEGNTWRDHFWGVSLTTGKGRNELGKILMEIRAELRASAKRDEDTSSPAPDSSDGSSPDSPPPNDPPPDVAP